jgi:hypothetical protein
MTFGSILWNGLNFKTFNLLNLVIQGGVSETVY